MSDTAGPDDPVSRGVERSRAGFRGWSSLSQHLYAAVLSALWLGMLALVVFIIVILVRDAPSPVLMVLMVWLCVFATVVPSWLFWGFAFPLYADLATGGRFTPWRATRLARFDSVFGKVALVVLLSAVLIPFLQLLE